MNQITVQNAKSRPLLAPVSRSTPFKSAYSSMRNYKWLCFNLFIGSNGDTDVTAGLMQAKNVTGASDKELIIRNGQVFECDAAASAESDKDKWVETALTNSGAAGSVIPINGLDNMWYKIYVHNDFLDVDNDFDCVAVQIYNTSAACLTAVWVDGIEPRFSGDPSDYRQTPSMAHDAGDKF